MVGAHSPNQWTRRKVCSASRAVSCARAARSLRSAPNLPSAVATVRHHATTVPETLRYAAHGGVHSAWLTGPAGTSGIASVCRRRALATCRRTGKHSGLPHAPAARRAAPGATDVRALSVPRAAVRSACRRSAPRAGDARSPWVLPHVPGRAACTRDAEAFARSARRKSLLMPSLRFGVTCRRYRKHTGLSRAWPGGASSTGGLLTRLVRPESVSSPRFGARCRRRPTHAGLSYAPGRTTRRRFGRPAQSGSPTSRVSEVLEGVPRPIRH